MKTLLEIVLFSAIDTFLGLRKLLGFGKEFMGTLGDTHVWIEGLQNKEIGKILELNVEFLLKQRKEKP